MGKKSRGSIIILSIVVLMCLIVSLVEADPFFWGGQVPPPFGTQPPTISAALENNSLLRNSNISFKVTASCISNDTYITGVYYVVDWKAGNNTVYVMPNDFEETKNLFRFVNLTAIPEGQHSIEVFANELGTYVNYVNITSYQFVYSNSLKVNFNVDTITPTISFSTPYQNHTFDTRDVELNFTINKANCQISYSLDNQSEIISNSDNSLTLNNLMNAEHNVTLYAKDKYGVLSDPVTISFDVNVPEPFPTVTVVAIASILVIITGVSVALLIYRKRNN